MGQAERHRRIHAPFLSQREDLALHHGRAAQGRHISTMVLPFLFTCPATGMHVQHWSDGDADVRENEYEGIICPACTRLHFLNRKTGKLLGQDGK
jgi:hypothetical protein